jgi:hypothetical protein
MSDFTRVEEEHEDGFLVSVDPEFLNNLGEEFIVWLKAHNISLKVQESILVMGHLVALIARNIDWSNGHDDGRALGAIGQVAEQFYKQLVEPTKQ